MKPLAAHGTYARYVGRPAGGIPGCRCQPCAEEGRRYVKRRDYLAAIGRPLTVDATPARQYLQHLFACGAGWHQLAAASGKSSSVIHAIVTGAQAEIWRTTEDAILAVRLDQALPADRSMPALGAIRRAQALAAIGHSPADIAAAAGISGSLVCSLIAGRTNRIFARTHTAIAAAFTKLAMTPGRNQRTLRRAQQAGWAPPLAWDDDIDDPAARPVIDAAPARLTRTQLAEIRLTEIRHLAAYGTPANEIANRLGISVKHVTAVVAYETGRWKQAA